MTDYSTDIGNITDVVSGSSVKGYSTGTQSRLSSGQKKKERNWLSTVETTLAIQNCLCQLLQRTLENALFHAGRYLWSNFGCSSSGNFGCLFPPRPPTLNNLRSPGRSPNWKYLQQANTSNFKYSHNAIIENFT